MAHAMKCDRCGKYGKYYDENRLYKIRRYNERMVGIRFEGYHNMDLSIDLCDDCLKALIKFLGFKEADYYGE